ncbi:MAG: hypothetical protein ABFR97_11250 [Thermodesulfobacteriota bacterium]
MMKEQGGPDKGDCGFRPWNEEGGALSLLAAGGIFVGVLILFMVINISNIWATRSQLSDAAEMMAGCVLKNQLEANNPDAAALIRQLAADAGLTAQHPNMAYQYQFGYTLSDGGNFIAIANSNPTPADFFVASGNNPATRPAIALEARTPVLNLGNIFTLAGTIRGRYIGHSDAPLESSPSASAMDCYCQSWCGDLRPVREMICMGACMFFTMMRMMVDIFTMDADGFLQALRCLIGDMVFTMHTMAETAWDWAWTAHDTIVEIHAD